MVTADKIFLKTSTLTVHLMPQIASDLPVQKDPKDPLALLGQEVPPGQPAQLDPKGKEVRQDQKGMTAIEAQLVPKARRDLRVPKVPRVLQDLQGVKPKEAGKSCLFFR